VFYLYERSYALTVVAGIGGNVIPVAAGSPTHATIGYGYRLSVSTVECPRHNRIGILGHLKTSDRDRVADLNGNTLCVASKVDRNDRSTSLLDADHVHSRSHRVAGATLGSLRRRWTSRYIDRCHSTCDSNGCRVECPGLCRCS